MYATQSGEDHRWLQVEMSSQQSDAQYRTIPYGQYGIVVLPTFRGIIALIYIQTEINDRAPYRLNRQTSKRLNFAAIKGFVPDDVPQVG